ncbi:hypothetical protein HYE82_18985 [Streptomyces sp. BR123]|uniref:hypothetical protein n=1 Tax=Streptomyces sp. BR123 TaxID=2749828 RepID=UPI0015C4C533|nr:hypothetical protein [Streptomyces sp. BR123]NXY96438.1 hypothetical protein [Streptomyces sp. BR123]
MSTSTPQTAALPDPETDPDRLPRASRGGARTAAAALCAVLGTGLLAAAALTGWAERHAAGRPPTPEAAYRTAASLWRAAPADSLFPPVLTGPDSGPGGADRTWTRVALAPDSDCGPALAPDWQTALAPTGCTRVLRATYADATGSSLVAVGMVFTPADATAMAGLRGRLPAPPAYGFADARRAAWTASVLADAPVVVYTVSAFADGRTLEAPVPAEEAMRKNAPGAVAQAGLGHEAKAVADRMEGAVRSLASPTAPKSATAAAPGSGSGPGSGSAGAAR